MRKAARVDQLMNLTERAKNGGWGESHRFIGTLKKKNHTDVWTSFPEILL